MCLCTLQNNIVTNILYYAMVYCIELIQIKTVKLYLGQILVLSRT